MKIEAVLARNSQPFECMVETQSMAEAINLLDRHSIGSVGVVAGRPGPFRGLITQSEVMSALAEGGCRILEEPVSRHVRSHVLTCAPVDDADKVLQAMTRHRHRHAIVKSEADQILGLVSLGDIAASMLDDVRLEASVLRDMARSSMLRFSL